MKAMLNATLRALGVAALLSASSVTGLAQVQYPQKPIKAVQGFAVGGNADTIARLIGSEMAKALNQAVVVEAVTGVGGTLGSAAVSRAAPDGYTLLLATGGHAVSGALYEKLPYDTVKSFEMVSAITYFPFLVVVNNDSKLRNFQELLAAGRSSEGLAYPSRWLGMPEVATVGEQGVPGYDVRSWAGWMLPAGTPPAIVNKLNEATRQALIVPQVRSQLRTMGGEAQASSPKEMTTLVEQEVKKWKQVVNDAGIAKS